MNLMFAKMRRELSQAIPASPTSQIAGKQAVTSRSDQVTTGWRDLGGPFYRALALQREREKVNQHLREAVALKKAELESLKEELYQLGLPRVGSQRGNSNLAAFSFSDWESSPLAGVLPAASSTIPPSSTGPASATTAIASGYPQPSAAQVQSDSSGRRTKLQANTPQLPLPNTPHFPAATSPRTSPSPLDLESEGDAQELRIFSQPGALGSPLDRLDDALKHNVSSLSIKVDAPTPQKPPLQRSDSATSSVSLSQMNKNAEGQGSTQRR